MKSQVETLPKSTVKLSIQLTADEMKRHYQAVVSQLAKQADIKGFRKGKAPRAVLEQRFGAEYIAHEALERAISLSYYEAVQKHKIQAVGRPQTELPDDHHQTEKTGLSFVSQIPVLPKVDLGDYRNVKVKKTESAYSDALVEEALDQLRKSRAVYNDVDRPAQVGDRVEIDFVGTRKGVEIEGGKSENHPLVLGEDNFIPGFADQLKKQSVGQVKKFKIKFPKDYHEPTLAGEKVEFTVTTKKVQERILPELDDKFAAELGAKSMSDLRDRLSQNLRTEKDLDAKRTTEEAVLEKILEQVTLEVPDALVREEAERLVQEFQNSVEAQGMPFEKYLQELGKSRDEVVADRMGDAERRVKISMILAEVAKAEKIKATKAAVDAEFAAGLASASDGQREQLDETEYRSYLERVLGNQAVLDTLVTRATE